MGSKFFYTIKTHFQSVNNICNKFFVISFVYDHMYRFSCFICSYAFYLFVLLFRQMFRFQKGENFKYRQIGSSWCQDSEIDKKKQEKEENSVVMETNRYEFLSGKDISGFIEEPATFSFTVHELFIDSNNGTNDNTPISFDSRGSINENFQGVGLVKDTKNTEEETEKAGDFVKCFVSDDVSDVEQEHETLTEDSNFDEDLFFSDDEVNGDMGFENLELDNEKTECSVGSLVHEEVADNPELAILTEEDNYNTEHVNSTTSEFSGEGAADKVLEHEIAVSINREEGEQEIHVSINRGEEEQVVIDGIGPENSVLVDDEKEEKNESESEDFLMRYQSTDSDDEYIELQPQRQNSVLVDEEILSRENSSKFEDKQEEEEFEDKQEEEEEFEDKQEEEELMNHKAEPKPEEQNSSNCYAQSDADYMFEHEDIIDQLKMEIKLARTGGLPTILEESESEESKTPRTVPELKPMKINDQKIEHKDLLDGIQKVYKSYSDKMRKLDILNFQTMHALGLLHVKDTVEFQKARKLSVPAIMSTLSQNLWPCKGIAVIDPMNKVIADMHKVFETIYVGQLCLSWEILNWQYCKIQELQKFDSQRSCQYNQVAGEFQLFQVLLQRFLENEQFQGPRVENYVNNRCVLRNLLQVPLVKDDGCKSEDDEDKITSEMLKELIEQAMIVFWEFLRADKDESNMVLYHQNHFNLQDMVDLELLADIRTDFQKKEKKLKEIQRSGNCIVKRFKKQQEGQIHRIHTLFIAQVEMKLVSRVLNMSKLTRDQLIWCHEKLDKINFFSRKVFVESSFLLLPC